jgi:hypothetical protein
MLVTQGSHFDHPNGSILVTRGVSVFIQAAVLVTQRFHFDHSNGSQEDPVCIQAAMLVTQGFHFGDPNGSILV